MKVAGERGCGEKARRHSAIFTMIFMVGGCRNPISSEVHVALSPEPFVVSTKIEAKPDSNSAALEPNAMMGRGLFEQRSSNSCLFCHGGNGKGGLVNTGVDLSRPTTWKVYLALGGKAAYQSDRKTFVARMKIATTALIRDGAILHNAQFKEPWFNWNAPSMTPYKNQMLGLGGSASQHWMSLFEDVGMTPTIAAEAAWIHLGMLDSQGILAPRGK